MLMTGMTTAECTALAAYDYPCVRLAWSASEAQQALSALGRLWSRSEGRLGRMHRTMCRDLLDVRVSQVLRETAITTGSPGPCEMMRDLAPRHVHCSRFSSLPDVCRSFRVGQHPCEYTTEGGLCSRSDQAICDRHEAFDMTNRFLRTANASRVPSIEQIRQQCEHAQGLDISVESLAREKATGVIVNGKVLSMDDILYGYETLFQRRLMFSAVTFHRTGMQQNPSDAIAIADLLWRVRPRLMIELGTSGGGSALYFARTMLGYDPEARVLTMDPAQDTVPLVNWNQASMRTFCPHCVPANATGVWSKAVRYLREIPPSALAQAEASRLAEQAMASGGLPVLVMEDSNHEYANVRANIWAYHKFVTPGSYLIVQDTRLGRYTGVTRAVAEFLAGPGKSLFVRDRRPEYFLYSQHAGGFLRRLLPGEKPGEWDQGA